MVAGLAPQPWPLCLLALLPYLTTHDSKQAKDRSASSTPLYTNTAPVLLPILQKVFRMDVEHEMSLGDPLIYH